MFNGMYSPIKVDAQGHFLYGTAFGLLRLDTTKMKRLSAPLDAMRSNDAKVSP